MIRKVLFSADDFGLSKEVNEAVERAHTTGILSTASLMITGDAVEDAIQRAKRMPNLNVGLHLVLVEGNSALPHKTIPDLVNEKNSFPSDPVKLGFKYFFDFKIRHQLAAEIEAQINIFQKTGLKLSHIDVHKHMHLHPTIGRLLIDIVKRLGINNIRLPKEPIKILKLIKKKKNYFSGHSLYYWSKILENQLKQSNINYFDWCFGIDECGHMNFNMVSSLLKNLPPGRSEIFFHPSTSNTGIYHQFMPSYEPIEELKALCNPKLPKLLRELNISPISWADI
ncbi:Chitooligosaccharide deacetylase ChbG [Commensalibacter sp. Nvir]|uniref:hopanoid biosynthesis-associated protein HpnK n=1 Tax=Commensalibacter sp. Nvir TaxID=3069817 RepID=UPI002D533E8C|nr:Chitooligosaccharide deacetylase ChbG [Commensalibacter sp. Nvir]